jgi:hypothetical protein
MFHRMRNPRDDGTVRALECVRRRLPPGWSAIERAGDRERALTFRGPDRSQASFALLARKAILPRDVRVLLAEDRKATLVVAPYLGARTRDLLTDAGISYADATGNLRIVASSPAIFLEGIGADQDPERQVRPLNSLRGAAAGRVVRALCEFAPPFGVRALADVSATPLGTVSRVVSFLETEALLTRDEKKQVVSVDWAALLKRWANDYGVATSNVMRAYLEPRGLGALWPKLASLRRYAATGSVAGTGIAPARLAMIYVDDTEAAGEVLDLVETEAGANVWLLKPSDDVVFERVRQRVIGAGDSQAKLTIVSPPQAVVDLMSSPGRGPQEAEALVEKMRGTVDEWQRAARS